MDILIKNATIVDSSTRLHFLKKDILIVNGIIKSIEDLIDLTDINIISKKTFIFHQDGLILAFVLENLDMKKEKQFQTV